MKKLVFIIIIVLLNIKQSNALSLNFRTNTLMFYEYSNNGENNYFKMYTSNTTNHLLYSESPEKEPSYQIDYQNGTDLLNKLEPDLQNKIKKYIWETEREQEFGSQMLYYMNTQMLIWKSFHPELDIKIEKGFEALSKAEKEMEEKWGKTPDWIKDYEINETLELSKKSDIKLSSTTCEIKENDTTWIIENCEEKATIEIKETKEETLNTWVTENAFLIESGYSPRKWAIQIINKSSKEEIKEEKKEEEKEILPSQKTENPVKNHNKITIEKVPNTMENQKFYGAYYLFLFCILKICQKQK